jgi:hypothetical protein
LSTAYAYTSEVMTQNMLAHDAAEGIGAFIEKRKPVWKDAWGVLTGLYMIIRSIPAPRWPWPAAED